jgi:hypothetical protein
MLILTNGDSATGAIRAAGIAGEILPWRDVLHDGPVPTGLELDDLSGVGFLPIVDGDHLSRFWRIFEHEMPGSNLLGIMRKLFCGLNMICTTSCSCSSF